MSFSAIVRILVWSCFALVASHTTNTVFGLKSVDAELVSLWNAKDAGVVAPSRVQVVSNVQSFIRSNASSSRDAAREIAQLDAELPTAFFVAAYVRRQTSFPQRHIDPSSNGARAPPAA